jgi:hypothetical protein
VHRRVSCLAAIFSLVVLEYRLILVVLGVTGVVEGGTVVAAAAAVACAVGLASVGWLMAGRSNFVAWDRQIFL